MTAAELAASFPKLTDFAETSRETYAYNCHAWGADDNLQWWQPGPTGRFYLPPWMDLYWPLSPSEDGSLAAFQKAHGTVGFEICSDGELEDGFEKIVHYVFEGTDQVSHTARQLPWGTWTSKLGPDIDIEHATPEQLEGPSYGRVAGFMARPEQARHVASGTQIVQAQP